MPESIVFDPTELSTRGELDITSWVAFSGINWGDAQLTAYMSELAVGSSPVDYRVANRQITIPLVIKASGGTTFAAARSAIQAKVGIWQQQGGWIKRVTSSGGTVFADVVNASLSLGGDWLQANRDVDINASLSIETIPDFYKAEETLSDHTETTLPDITFTETTANGGDFPLGDRVRIVVDDDQGQNQRGLIWSMRARNYSSASTAATAYEAEALTPLDTATRVAKVGASGGTVVTHGTLSTNWTPVLSTNLSAGSYLTHTGTNRVYARVFSTSGTTVQARFVYDVGDLVYPTENDAVRLYDGGTFHILDLGEVRLDQPANTTGYRWQGQIQAKGDAGSENFSVDRVWVTNTDESAGVARAPWVASPAGFTGFSAQDDFNQTAGTLTSKTLPTGGTWVGAGDADDFSVDASHYATRAANSDTSGLANGRVMTASSPTLTDTWVQASIKISARPSTYGVYTFALVFRYASASSFAGVYLKPGDDSVEVGYYTVTGGVTTLTAMTNLPGSTFGVGVFHRVGALVTAAGDWWMYLDGAQISKGNVPNFATGGTWASGKVGFADNHTSSGITRNVDGFSAWVPTLDAVVFASRSAELNTQGITRLDSGGTAYGPVSNVTGDLPRMPNRSSAGTVEFFLKSSRGDLQSVPDPGVDDVSVRVYRRAAYLTVG